MHKKGQRQWPGLSGAREGVQLVCRCAHMQEQTAGREAQSICHMLALGRIPHGNGANSGLTGCHTVCREVGIVAETPRLSLLGKS